MTQPPLFIGITTLPHRIDHLRPTLESLLAGRRRPDRIFLALPWATRREGAEYVIPAFLAEAPFAGLVEIVRTERDWGSGTKLLGVLPRIEGPAVLIVADDDVSYREDFAEGLYAAQCADRAASFSYYTYRAHGMTAGQGCDGFSFWTPNLAGIEAFFDRHVEGTRLVFHDDLWISYFLNRRGIRIRSLAHRLGDELIYRQNHEIDALRNRGGEEARDLLTETGLDQLSRSAGGPWSLVLPIRLSLAALKAKRGIKALAAAGAR